MISIMNVLPGIASMLVVVSGFTHPTLELARPKVDAGRTLLHLADPSQTIVANITAFADNEGVNALLTETTILSARRNELPPNIMRPPPDPFLTSWEGIRSQLISKFNIDPRDLDIYSADMEDTKFLLKIYRSMQLSRQFEVACNREYMMGKVRAVSQFDVSNTACC